MSLEPLSRVRHAAAALVLLIASLALPRLALAYGNQAHEIICEIAFQELNPTARAEVKRLIQQDDHYGTFADACSWPDEPRKRAKEHFINVPRHYYDIHTANCPVASECLYTAISKDSAVLSDPNASDQQKLESLKYLGHWIGDIHQPLHVSFQDDRGGNKIKESGTTCNDLHAVWDTCLIQKGFGTNAKKIAKDWRDGITDAERTAWTNSTAVDWANQSYLVTLAPETQYCVRMNGSCRYTAANETFSGDDDDMKTVVVDADYIDDRKLLVELQMKKAGIRLAKVLDELLGN
jgi:hypothetical protein